MDAAKVFITQSTVAQVPESSSVSLTSLTRTVLYDLYSRVLFVQSRGLAGVHSISSLYRKVPYVDTYTIEMIIWS